MRKAGIGLLGLLVLGAGLAPSALGWERGTHAFIADQLKKGGGLNTIEAMYGATAPDAFNYLFTNPGLAYRDFLYGKTHFEAEKVLDAVRNGHEKAAALGFLSHNNEWGADRTAHTRSLTLDHTEGYAITKAKMMNAMLMADPGYAALVAGAPDAALEICHDIVEAAGDVILKRYDPTVGRKLTAMALRPRANIQNLMVRAYARDLAGFSRTTPFPLTISQAAQVIAGVETEFRTMTIGYGCLLSGDDETLIDNIIDQYKGLAGAFLNVYGLPVPDDATLTALISGGLEVALQLCQGDYMTEVLATVEEVRKKFKPGNF